MIGETLYYSDPYYFRVESLGKDFYAGVVEDWPVVELYEIWRDNGITHLSNEYTMEEVVIPMEFLA